VYVVVSSSNSIVVIEEKRREREKKKKSYFIKNGIEPLLPSCHPSVYDLYKLTGQTQTLVLRRKSSPTNVFYKKDADRPI
jgi:hypothetical protein